MKENNLLQKKLAKYTKKYSMPMKIMLPILRKKDLGLPPARKFAILTCMDVLIQQNMQVCQRVMPM
jgi:carbonic anhydrase